jgi:putative membrane protein
MRKLCYFLSAAMLALSVSSCMDNRRAKNYNDKTLADDEGLAFIKNGIEGGRTEIKASELAKKNSTNPRIISFADMMIADHTSATNELKNIQVAKLVDISPGITTDHQAKIDSLATKTGADFDKAYITMMVADHESAEHLFAEATNNTSNMIQDFSRKILPKIQMHLDSAKAILGSLK